MNTISHSLRLRALEPEDLDMLYRIENDEHLWAIGPTSVPYSRYALHDYVAHQSGDIYQDRQVRLVIELANGQVAGLVDIVEFDPKNLRAEVGVVVEQPLRRQGIARQALETLHSYALSTLHLRQLYAVVASDNEASLSLFRQLGYTDNTQLRDWLYDGRCFRDALLMQKLLC